MEFPFTPYDCQRDYMEKVLECLQRRVNGVLESPTGTGKTLCLLCAALAWRERFKDDISARKIAERTKGAETFPQKAEDSWGSAAGDGDRTMYYSDVPKIIYASRTHSQLTQVIGELKNTCYRPKVCVLGSREQLCINPEVTRQESNHVKVHMCRGKVSTRSCVFYNNVEEKSTDRDLTSSILDVEDLVKFGNKQRVCPYYLSRSLKQSADIVFMPYNYLLDPKSRRAHNIELSGAVVIFDEAHNVERTCEESISFDLTPYDLASAISAVDRLLLEQTRELSHDVSEDINVESLGSGSKLTIAVIAKVKQFLLDLEAAIDSYELSSDKGLTKPGIFIYELLERAQLRYNTKAAISEALEQILGHLAGQPGVFLNTTGLQKLSDIIQVVFCGDPAPKDLQQQMKVNTAHFKVHLHQDTSYQKKKQSTDVWATTSSSSKKQGNTLSYWCFSPGFSMQDLVNQGVRCIILTSGTLSPLSSFTCEMRIEFPVLLENKHVIERDQIFVGIVEKGPDGVQLSSAFDRRFVPENMASLGNTVANLSRVVPHGLLVFFPSFPLMEKTLDFWKTNGHADRIQNNKPMFVEPKGKGTFNEVIDGYYSKVNDPASKGGTFFAVCRGKASEGLDFADTFGRGVIITGLPFPPRMDPRVILKMQYLDEMCSGKIPGMKYLSGQAWYRQQAFRAVNQAVGRVIRHKEDFGAIFLCDQRFRNADVRNQLPSWLRPYVRLYDSFGNLVRDASQFFRVAQKMRPVVVKQAAAESCEEQLSPPPCSSSCFSSSSLRHSNAQMAKVLDAHLPSLKRKRLNGVGGGEAGGSRVARLCVQYDGEVQDSRRRPASLLDALERGERLAGGEEEAARGEAGRLSTRSLQLEKRLEEEQRGGRRKIRLVPGQGQQRGGGVSEENAGARARSFLEEMKSSLSQSSFQQVIQALQKYKKTDDVDVLLAETSVLTEDQNTHSLLRGFYQFVRPHHKKEFDARCQELTGQGCGYKPDHSLSRDQRTAAMLCSDRDPAEVQTSSGGQLDTQQLNGGGPHLSQQGLSQVQGGSAGKRGVYQAFMADVKAALGEEKYDLLYKAVSCYKKTENYDNMVSTVVSLLTEREQDYSLLARFGLFVRPQHKKQFEELLVAITGGAAQTQEESQEEASVSPPKTQSKISSFFFSSQRR